MITVLIPGGQVKISPDSILLVHENTKKGHLNIFHLHGEILVKEVDFFEKFDISGFEAAFTRFNPSTAANQAGISTRWENGEQYHVWYSRQLPIITAGGKTGVMVMGKFFRIEL